MGTIVKFPDEGRVVRFGRADGTEESATVIIRAKGGGLTVGKSKISDGRGSFSDVANISEVYGSYAAAEANAGMGRSATAQAMTKGTVSLELTGKGEGIDLGVSFGRFTISKHK